MTIQVLNSLWDKICNVFATKSELADIVENKQDRLTAGIGIRIEGNTIINQAIPTTEKEEIVQVAITFDSQESLPSEFDITEDLPITVFCNNEPEPFGTYNLDGYGMCSFTIPYGYRYRIEFPTLLGYKFVDDEEHIATVIERSIEIEYKTIPTPSEEDLTHEKVIVWLHCHTYGLNVVSVLNNREIEVIINNETTTYITDSSGAITFYVPIGDIYTINVPIIENYYLELLYSKTFLAKERVNVTYFDYYRYNSGLFAVDKDGIYELRKNELEAAISAEILSEEDIKYIEYKTSTTILYNATFFVDVDDIADHSHNLKRLNSYLWGKNTTSNKPLSPVICNVSNQSVEGVTAAVYGEQYYNGYLVNNLLLLAGDELGIATPLIDTYLSTPDRLLGYNRLRTFLPSWWLHYVLYDYCHRDFYRMMKISRPEAQYLHIRTSTGGGLDYYYTCTIYGWSDSLATRLSGWYGGSIAGPYCDSATNSYTLKGVVHHVYQYPCYNLAPYTDLEITTPHYIINNGIKVLCNEDGNIATLFDVDEENNVTWKAITWDSNGLNIITLNDLNWQDILDLIETNGKCYFLSGGGNKFLVGEDEYTWDEINNIWDSTITEFTTNALYRRLETDTWILCNSNGEEIITEDTDTGDIYYYTCDNDLISNLFRWDKTLLSTTLPSGTSGVSVPDGIVSGKITISGTDYQVDSPRRNAIYN